MFSNNIKNILSSSSSSSQRKRETKFHKGQFNYKNRKHIKSTLKINNKSDEKRPFCILTPQNKINRVQGIAHQSSCPICKDVSNISNHVTQKKILINSQQANNKPNDNILHNIISDFSENILKFFYQEFNEIQ